MLSCCYSVPRDVLRAASTLTFVVYLPIFLGALRAVRPVWASERDVTMLVDAWFPCLALSVAALFLLLAGAATFASCFHHSDTPFHLVRCHALNTMNFAHSISNILSIPSTQSSICKIQIQVQYTGATIISFPLQVAVIGLAATDGPMAQEIARADETGALTQTLTWIESNPEAAAVAAATWMALQTATVLSGLFVAACGPPGSCRSYYTAYGVDSPLMGVRAPLLPRTRHERHGSASTAGYLTPCGGEYGGGGSLGASPGRPQLPPVIVPTTGIVEP